MNSKKISAQEKQALRNAAKLELERLETLLSDEDTVQLIDSFKTEFNKCETVYKVILAAHQKHIGKKVTGHLTVSMTQVPHALKFAGYDFNKDLLTDIFGASSPRGTTIKKLRDALTHGIDENAINEILRREKELFGYMTDFLEKVRSFDFVAA